MQNNIRTISVVGLFILANIMVANENSVTDVERIRQASDSLVSQFIEEAGIVPASSISFVYEKKISNSVIYHTIVQNFFLRKISIADNSTDRDTVFEILVRGASISYGETFSESFLGTLKTERTISLTCDGAVKAHQKILWAGSKTVSLVDTVDYSEIDQLHSDNLPFASYSKPSLSFFDSILEPVVVTIASGVAIYLFFTIRS